MATKMPLVGPRLTRAGAARDIVLRLRLPDGHPEPSRAQSPLDSERSVRAARGITFWAELHRRAGDVPRPRLHGHGDPDDHARVRARQDHDGVERLGIQLDLRSVPDSRRLAGGPLRLADRAGGAITWWSIFTAATGGAFSAASLAVMRGLFGMGEAAAWPAASRSLLRWLPVQQRAFGQGFQHSGSRLGAAFAPTMVVFLIAHSGWRAVFYLFGSVGILVAIAWYLYYRDFPQEHFGTNAGGTGAAGRIAPGASEEPGPRSRGGGSSAAATCSASA